MKMVRVRKETWRKLMHLKIDLGVGNIDSAIQHLLSVYQREKQNERRKEVCE